MDIKGTKFHLTPYFSAAFARWPYEHFMSRLFEIYEFCLLMVLAMIPGNSRGLMVARKGIRCQRKKYPQNNWQNSFTTINRLSNRTLASQVSEIVKNGRKCRSRNGVF